jgi:hypothetical protein
MKTHLRTVGLMAALATCYLPVTAQDAEPKWAVTGYLQDGWPKQTATNASIHQINDTFGTHYKTWSRVDNVNLGVMALRRISPLWKVGFEADYSQGGIKGREAVNSPLLGPGSLAFDQSYSVYADMQVIIQCRPFGENRRVVPFASMATGIAYDQDRTTLDFTSSLDGSRAPLLRVDNHGWYPVLNLGIGMDVFLTGKRVWFVETQLGYTWARLKKTVGASGLIPQMAGTSTVEADTDNTGANLLVGLGRRF